MKHGKICAIASAIVCISTIAAAEPIISNNKYSAWLAEEGHLYTEDQLGSIKTLRSPIADLIGFHENELYCITSENRLYAIKMDGSGSMLIASNPDQATIEKYQENNPYLLQDSKLSVRISSEDNWTTLSENAGLVAHNRHSIFWTEENELYSVPIDQPLDKKRLYSALQQTPIALSASEDTIAILDDLHQITLLSLQQPLKVLKMTAQQETTAVVAYHDQLHLFAAAEPGYRYLASLEYSFADDEQTAAVSPVAYITVRETPAPTSQVKVTATAKKTATPTPKATKEPREEGSIDFGDRGNEVIAIQSRLQQLGYPIDKVDGIYGNITLTAVKLFQNAIGYRERSLLSAAAIEKLFAPDAPRYVPDVPVHYGTSGIRVVVLQKALQKQGYSVGRTVDGVYGDQTAKAVAAYQADHGLGSTGDADSLTLGLLYGLFTMEVSPTLIPVPSIMPEIPMPIPVMPEGMPDPIAIIPYETIQ